MSPNKKPRFDVSELQSFASETDADIQGEIALLLDRETCSIERDQIKEICVPRLRDLVTSVSSVLEGRENEIRAVVAALIAGTPAVLLGPPGTAKSLISREIAARFGMRSARTSDDDEKAATYFEYLLTAHTMPEELFGPIDLAALTNHSELQRNTSGMLPGAHLVFLDEVFRGSSQILNTLLTILNERKFHDGRRVLNAPLIGVIAASNKPPIGSELDAFYDRFVVRIWIDSLLDESSTTEEEMEGQMSRLIEKSSNNDRRQWINRESKTPEKPVACLHDLSLARALVVQQVQQKGTSSSSREREFLSVFREVRPFGKMSDRALYQMRKFAEALQLLDSSLPLVEAFRYSAPYEEYRDDVRVIVDNALALHGPNGAI